MSLDNKKGDAKGIYFAVFDPVNLRKKSIIFPLKNQSKGRSPQHKKNNAPTGKAAGSIAFDPLNTSTSG